MSQIVYVFIFLGIFLLLVVISHWLYRFLNVSSETSRKFLHVSGGLLALFAPLFFFTHWPVLILCISAFILLLFTYARHQLAAVHQTNRKSIGSVVFPIPIYICFLIATYSHDPLLFYLPISYLTISDTVAEWAGRKWEHRSVKLMEGQKTIAGSTGFALSSFVIAIIWGLIFKLSAEQILLISIVTSLVATITELISTKGFDNLTVPIMTLSCLLLLRSH
jgi:phytol kinase